MDGWLKGLIAAACVVVIASGGYFAWSEYRAAIDRTESERIAKLRGERQMCDLMMREFASDSPQEDWRIIHVVTCVVNEHVKESDFDTPRLRPYLEKAKESIAYQRERQGRGAD